MRRDRQADRDRHMDRQIEEQTYIKKTEQNCSSSMCMETAKSECPLCLVSQKTGRRSCQ